jgi:hypothetical protein
MPLEIREIDRQYYESRLKAFLPERIIDIHAHIWCNKPAPAPCQQGTAGWAGKVVSECSIDDLLNIYTLLFPAKSVTPLVFGNPLYSDAVEKDNAYVQMVSRRHQLPALMLSHPAWSTQQLEDKLAAGAFIGIKPYLTFAPEDIAPDDIEIFDFLPNHHLQVLNQRGLICMLHIPRSGRLKDPVNIEQICQIEKRYPNIRLIIAHVGRAYCEEHIGDAFEILKNTDHVMFDISANTNACVFERLIKAVGPQRILFGSDLPITEMRMRRICENATYINIVPRGLYPDVSGDKHIREVTGSDAESLTFFLYEQVNALRRAAETAGLFQDDVRDVFFNNAARIIESCKNKP